jgi:hypothetical protein
LLARTWWSAVKNFGVLDIELELLTAVSDRGAVVVVVVVVRLDVMPGGVVGAGAAGPVLLVVCARTGHAISAVAAIMVPSEACLAMVKCLPTRQGTNGCLCGRFGPLAHKRTCGAAR